MKGHNGHICDIHQYLLFIFKFGHQLLNCGTSRHQDGFFKIGDHLFLFSETTCVSGPEVRDAHQLFGNRHSQLFGSAGDAWVVAFEDRVGDDRDRLGRRLTFGGFFAQHHQGRH